MQKPKLKPEDISLLIEMAWCDKTDFKDIQAEFGLSEGQVMKLMKANLKKGSYEVWRKRVQGQVKQEF